MANNGLRTICVGYKDYIRKGARQVDETEVRIKYSLDRLQRELKGNED